jgi:hypothetical protein
MKKIINTLLIMAVLVSVSSCMQEIPNDPIGGDADVVLHVQTSEGFGGSDTKSAFSLADENTIDHIHVLVFNSGNNLVDVKVGAGLPTGPGVPVPPNFSGTGSFTVTLTASASTSDADKFRLVILANAAKIVEDNVGIGKAIKGDPAYANVIARLSSAIDGKMFPTEKRIPMWGETVHITISEANKNQTIDLVRAVARIDAGAGAWNGTSWAGLSNFELTSIHIAKANKGFTVIPGAANRGTHPVHGTFLATNPTPNGDKFDIDNDLSKFKYDTPTGSTIREIYVPEANVKMGGVKPGDTGHLERMAVIIGGKYDGSATSTYYRVDFAKRVNGEIELINVLRNHLYRFNIASVSGPGYPDPETAYRNMSMNINVNVVEWETESSEIFADGVFWIKLANSSNENRNDRTAILYREEGSTDIIRFETSDNISFADLVMSGTGWVFPDTDNKMVIENGQFRVAIKSDNNGRYFEFTALNDFSATATNNPSKITVTIPKSRITFDISILQVDADPIDWIGGPSIDVEVGG